MEENMKKITLIGLLLMSACGCTGMNNTEQGALTGAGIGGLLGALVGGRHARPAAAVGAVGGGLIGGTIGADKDRQEERRRADAIAVANAQAARQMNLDEIVQLSQRNTPDDIIIRQINSTGSVWPNLNTGDITYLQDQRVSPNVISYIQSRRYIYVQPRPVVYVAPPPPPVGGVVVIGR
jgi:hypothetical protein